MFCSYPVASAPTHTTHPLIVSRARACPISCSCTRSSSLPPFSSLPPLSSTCSGTYRSFSLQMKRSAFCSTQHDRMDVIPKSAKAQNWMPSMASSIPALEPVAYAPRRPCGVARDAVPNQSWLNNAAALKPLFPNRARASAHAGTGIGCRNGEGAPGHHPTAARPAAPLGGLLPRRPPARRRLQGGAPENEFRICLYCRISPYTES